MKLKPVEHDPFQRDERTTQREEPTPRPKLRPVDHDPFAQTPSPTKQPSQEAKTPKKDPKLKPVNFDPFTPTAGAGEAVSKSVENLPDVYKENVGGLMRMAGERSEEDFARERAMTPEEQAARDELVEAGTTNMGFVAETPNVPEEGEKNWLTESGKAMAKEAQKSIQENMPNLEPGTAPYYLYHGTTSLGQMVPAVVGTILTQNPAVGAALFAPVIGGTIYEEARQEGRTVDQATMDTTVKTAAESLSEMIPLGTLTKSGGKYLWRVGKSGLSEGVQEMINEGFNMLYDYGVIGEETTKDEAKRKLTDAFVIGSGVGTTMGIPSHMLTSSEPAPQSPADTAPDLTTEDSIEDADLTPDTQSEAEPLSDVQLAGEDQLATQMEQAFPGEAAPEVQEQPAPEPATPDNVSPITGEEIVMEGGAQPDLTDTLERQGFQARPPIPTVTDRVDQPPTTEGLDVQEIQPEEIEATQRVPTEGIEAQEIQPEEIEATGLTADERERTIQALEQELGPQDAQPETAPSQAAQEPTETVVQSPGDINSAVRQAAESPDNNLPEPTDAQRRAGNYRKARINLRGLPITVENPKGSTRKGVRGDGKRWRQKMKDHYGYLRGVEGADKDKLDVFIGPKATNEKHPVHVVEQVNPKTGRFDEFKIVLGAANEQEAQQIYRRNYEPGWKGDREIRQMSMEEFQEWTKGDGPKRSLKSQRAPATPESEEVDARQPRENEGAVPSKPRESEATPARTPTQDRATPAQEPTADRGKAAPKEPAKPKAKPTEKPAPQKSQKAQKPAKAESKPALQAQAGDRTVTFKPNPRAESADEAQTTIMLDTDRLDAAWQREMGMYLPRRGRGESEVEGRRQRAKEFIETGETIEAPIARLKPDGTVALEDGRHRFAALRDMGAKQVAVTVNESEAAELQERFTAPKGEQPSLDTIRKAHAKVADDKGYLDVLINEVYEEVGGDRRAFLDAVEQASREGKVIPNVGDWSLSTPEERKAAVYINGQPHLRMRAKEDRDAGMFAMAYHASPHEFERFDISKIGTGEGAQAFGYGLYFAENPITAENYLMVFDSPGGATRPSYQVGDKRMTADELSQLPNYEAAALTQAASSPTGTITQSFIDTMKDRGEPQAYIDALEKYKGVKVEPAGASLYKVDIPDSAVAKMLDWDKPLSEQPKKVKELFTKHGFDESENAGVAYLMLPEKVVHAKRIKELNETIRQEDEFYTDAYFERKSLVGDEKGASEWLLEQGIPGIKYLDQGSRSQGEGTRNFVVFDDSLITILERNGEPVTGAEREQALASMRSTGRGTGMTTEAAHNSLRQILGKKAYDRLVASGRFEILRKPSEVVEGLTAKEDANVKGRYDPDQDKSYLFADNIAPDELWGVFLHEVGAHYGLPRMIGRDEYNRVKKQLQNLHKLGNKRVVAAYNRVPENTPDKYFWDEVLAYLTENPANHQMGMVRRVIAKIRAFLKELGVLHAMDMKVDDIVSLVRGAATHAARTAPKSATRGAQEGTALFSKEESPEQKRERLRRMGMDFEDLPGDLEGNPTQAQTPEDVEPEAVDPETALEELERQGFDKPMFSMDEDGREGALPEPNQQERAQRSLSGNRANKLTTDEDGLLNEDPRMDPLSRDLIKTVGFFESATDKLRRSKHPILQNLAHRVDTYYDRNEARMGWVNGRVRPILNRIPMTQKKHVMRDFKDYWRHFDNGREQEAAAILNRSPQVRELVSEVKRLYGDMGDVNQKAGVQVYDAGLNEGKGGWRGIGKVPEGKFWPRAFSPEVQRVLSNPKNDPKLWDKLVSALIDEGHIETREEADKYLRRYMGREVANDYFSGIEKARQRKLPEVFYDYSWDAFNRYARKWSSRVTQIEQFGQKTGPGSEDVFEQVINSTKDQHTQNYVAALSDHVYSRRSTDIYTTLLQHLNLIATGTQLGNPATATLNFIGGTTLNVQMFGWRRVAKSYATMLRDWKRIQQTGVDLGILGKDVLNILRDTEQSAATYMDASGRVQDSLAKFAAFTMKWGGYKGTENIIRMNAMMSSWIQLQDALQRWNRNPKSSISMKYRAFMQRNRIDPDKLLAENGKGPETARYLRRMVNIPQGSYRPDMVPLYVDSPVGRFLFKYQKFGTQVSRMFWQNHLQPFVKTVAGGEKVLLPGQKLQPKTGNIIDEKTGKVVKSNRVRTFLPLLRYFATALLGGSAILAARSFMFNYNDPGPEWDDLAEALDDDDEGEDRSLMWAMIFDRAYYSLFAASAAGFFGNYIQFGMDFADQQRVKNPLDPPGLASIDAVVELVMRSQEQGKLTARDLDNIGEQTLALYRGYKRMGTKAMAMSGSGWKEARLRDAYTDLVYTKKMTRRFADQMDMKGRRTFSGRWGKTPMSPYNQQAYEALLLGDPESARAAFKQARQEMEEPSKVSRSMKSSVRARHPWNIGASQARANHSKFLQWAEKHTSKSNYQRILEIGRRYDKARSAAGL